MVDDDIFFITINSPPLILVNSQSQPQYVNEEAELGTAADIFRFLSSISVVHTVDVCKICKTIGLERRTHKKGSISLSRCDEEVQSTELACAAQGHTFCELCKKMEEQGIKVLHKMQHTESTKICSSSL